MQYCMQTLRCFLHLAIICWLHPNLISIYSHNWKLYASAKTSFKRRPPQGLVFHESKTLHTIKICRLKHYKINAIIGFLCCINNVTSLTFKYHLHWNPLTCWHQVCFTDELHWRNWLPLLSQPRHSASFVITDTDFKCKMDCEMGLGAFSSQQIVPSIWMVPCAWHVYIWNMWSMCD